MDKKDGSVKTLPSHPKGEEDAENQKLQCVRLQVSEETAVIVVALAIYKPNQQGTGRLRKKEKNLFFFGGQCYRGFLYDNTGMSAGAPKAHQAQRLGTPVPPLVLSVTHHPFPSSPLT